MALGARARRDLIHEVQKGRRRARTVDAFRADAVHLGRARHNGWGNRAGSADNRARRIHDAGATSRVSALKEAVVVIGHLIHKDART